MAKYKVIPVGRFLPYTLSDLSVVIPQASQYVRRIKWFLPQFISATPLEVVKNTIVVYDPEDEVTRAELAKYADRGIRGITTTPPHSTYKMEAGFKEVKTRLCARMHNDTFVTRDDWAEMLIKRFNSSYETQLIGAFNPSGTLDEKILQKISDMYPAWKSIFDNLEFADSREVKVISACFLSAFFMAAQTYVFKGIYPLVVEINEGKMDKEDSIFLYLASIFNINIIYWSNMYDFLTDAGSSYGDFEESRILPTTAEQIKITGVNREFYPLAEFRGVNYAG